MKSIKSTGVFRTMSEHAIRLRLLGKTRSSENCLTTLKSFQRFRQHKDLRFSCITNELMEEYEAYLKAHGLKRNTTSFYMRNLRAVYNRAVEQGWVKQTYPFKKVYTGIDKTTKRALPLEAIKRIKALELPPSSTKSWVRDLFLMSFYLRGMSFIDMAYLRKKDLQNGVVHYTRKKTEQQLSIRWEKQMQEILDRYPDTSTSYLLPIIENEDGTERNQYLKRLAAANRVLKQIGRKAGIQSPLTMYVARHSWASIARDKHIALSVISEGMGHNSEATTQIYLSNIQTTEVDNANRKILKEL